MPVGLTYRDFFVMVIIGYVPLRLIEAVVTYLIHHVRFS
jgi:hypothetical protein